MKTGEKGETGVHRGSTGLVHQHLLFYNTYYFILEWKLRTKSTLKSTRQKNSSIVKAKVDSATLLEKASNNRWRYLVVGK